MIDLNQIQKGLAGYCPVLRPTDGMRLAAVTMLLRTGPASPEVLLIERAKREGDPWSGHMAFPGGRSDPQDPSLQKTAERETLEEVGIGLEGASVIGQLDDLGGRAAEANKMVVSAYVFQLDEPGPLVIDRHEVADAFWVPLDHLVHPDNHVRYPMQYHEHEVIFPGISVGNSESHVVWGLTYRFLETFFEIIGNPLPEHGIPDPESLARLSE